jgi:hypothetical protein
MQAFLITKESGPGKYNLFAGRVVVTDGNEVEVSVHGCAVNCMAQRTIGFMVDTNVKEGNMAIHLHCELNVPEHSSDGKGNQTACLNLGSFGLAQCSPYSSLVWPRICLD